MDKKQNKYSSIIYTKEITVNIITLMTIFILSSTLFFACDQSTCNWPQETGYLTSPKKRPSKPYDMKTSTKVEIIAIRDNTLLLSKNSKLEFRQDQPLLFYPGSEVRYLCKSPNKFEFKDYNGDVCLLSCGITVKVDKYGQFSPVSYKPEDGVLPPTGDIKTEAKVLKGGLTFNPMGNIGFTGVIGGEQVISY